MRLNKSKSYRNFKYLKTVMPIFRGLGAYIFQSEVTNQDSPTNGE